MKKFKVGDIVKCISPIGVLNSKEHYKVESQLNSNSPYVRINGEEWHENRFELVKGANKSTKEVAIHVDNLIIYVEEDGVRVNGIHLSMDTMEDIISAMKYLKGQ